MRGEICIGLGSLFSFTAVLILIFAHVGQISTASLPRQIYMVQVNMSGYLNGLQALYYPNDIGGLYTSNASAPLQQQQGVRQLYDFGFYSYCAYTNATAGICSNHSTPYEFKPYNYILADMTTNYSQQVTPSIISGNFRNSNSLGSSSRAGYFLTLLGTIAAALAFITGFFTHGVPFFISTSMAILSTIFLLVGAAIWTSLINKASTVNLLTVAITNQTPVPLGITVHMGTGVYLIWAAFACMIASIVPYMISCCTWR